MRRGKRSLLNSTTYGNEETRASNVIGWHSVTNSMHLESAADTKLDVVIDIEVYCQMSVQT